MAHGSTYYVVPGTEAEYGNHDDNEQVQELGPKREYLHDVHDHVWIASRPEVEHASRKAWSQELETKVSGHHQKEAASESEEHQEPSW